MSWPDPQLPPLPLNQQDLMLHRVPKLPPPVLRRWLFRRLFKDLRGGPKDRVYSK
jgi:hypothetical protein